MRIFILATLLLAAVPASALQVGDGQYNNTYNDLDLAATQARFNNITTKGAGGGVPVGTIIAWPVATNPEDMENWLECNGQAVSASAYPELRNLIGANVPDLRGLFLRGQGGNSSDLGIKQGDAIRNMTGTAGVFDYGDKTNGVTAMSYYAGNGYTATAGCCRGRLEFDASRQVPTANENRPVNMAVRYLIRALP